MKIYVIGNTAGGKTRLSRRLSEVHHIPLTNVDQLQYLPGLQVRPHQETEQQLQQVMIQSSWIIDGFGPLESFEQRLKIADHIIFVDFPIWRHAWWLCKRQLTSLWRTRAELPQGTQEWRWAHTQKMLDYLKKVHWQMRPELIRILNRPENYSKLCWVRQIRDWNELYHSGISVSSSI